MEGKRKNIFVYNRNVGLGNDVAVIYILQNGIINGRCTDIDSNKKTMITKPFSHKQ